MPTVQTYVDINFDPNVCKGRVLPVATGSRRREAVIHRIFLSSGI
jgi:hypothetical protein